MNDQKYRLIRYHSLLSENGKNLVQFRRSLDVVLTGLDFLKSQQNENNQVEHSSLADSDNESQNEQGEQFQTNPNSFNQTAGSILNSFCNDENRRYLSTSELHPDVNKIHPLEFHLLPLSKPTIRSVRVNVNIDNHSVKLSFCILTTLSSTTYFEISAYIFNDQRSRSINWSQTDLTWKCQKSVKLNEFKAESIIHTSRLHVSHKVIFCAIRSFTGARASGFSLPFAFNVDHIGKMIYECEYDKLPK